MLLLLLLLLLLIFVKLCEWQPQQQPLLPQRQAAERTGKRKENKSRISPAIDGRLREPQDICIRQLAKKSGGGSSISRFLGGINNFK